MLNKESFFKLVLKCVAICIAALPFSMLGQTAPTTVVLVHGAFADGSSWNKVIPLLQAKGLRVVAVQIPLTSLANDIAVARRAIASAPGPVVLVGHFWGGMVITEAGADDRVKALVYISAFTPDAGQSAGDLVKPYPTPPGVSHPIVDGAGFLTLSAEDIARYFAPDVPRAEANLIAATQGPIRGANFADTVGVAAWRTKQSWLIAAEKDQMIAPALYRVES